MALDYTYCADEGFPRPHMTSLASFKQDDGFGNLIDTGPLESRRQGTRFLLKAPTLHTLTYSAGTDNMNSRKAFEKWAQSQRMSTDRWSDSDHNTEYTSMQTLRAWHAWQAATERAAGIVIEEGPVIGSAGVAIVAEKILKGNQ